MRAILILSVAFLAACTTTAGPFVSTISSDAEGQLHVTKCMVSMNGFLATVSATDCQSSVVSVGKPAAK